MIFALLVILVLMAGVVYDVYRYYIPLNPEQRKIYRDRISEGIL